MSERGRTTDGDDRRCPGPLQSAALCRRADAQVADRDRQLKRICEEHLAGRYTIEVIDLLINPQLAAGDQILAVPTLVRRLPPPLKRIIGNLSDTERVSSGSTSSQGGRSRDELARPPRDSDHYVLRLFVTGHDARGRTRAIENMRKICEEDLAGQYDLEIIDVYQNPEATRELQIIATPTLVKVLPEPLRRIIGDLSDHEKVLAGLNLTPR